MTPEQARQIVDKERVKYRAKGIRVNIHIEAMEFQGETFCYVAAIFPDRPPGRRTRFYWDADDEEGV